MAHDETRFLCGEAHYLRMEALRPILGLGFAFEAATCDS
jgi:hypothetical protein